MTPEEIQKEADKIQKAYRGRSAINFPLFAGGLIIPGQDGPQLFCRVMAPFQREFFESIAPSLHSLREGTLPAKQRFWLERTKKASKDADLAIVMVWITAFAKRPLYGQVGAGDKTQAGIVKERVEHLLFYNPWLNDYVELVQNEIRQKGGLAHVDILAADAELRHGGTPDILLINELSHIKKWAFAETLKSNAAGVARGIMVVATNAGYKGTPAEKWRQNAIEGEDWAVHVWDKPAPWTNLKFLADEKKTLPTSAFNRLWHGKWPSGKGDALSEDDIEACFQKKISEHKTGKKGWIYLAGLDLGISHDHAGLAVLAVSEKLRKIQLAYFQAWEPDPRTGEVDLIAVENGVRAIHTQLPITRMFYDPAQAKLMAQRLKQKYFVEEMTFTPGNCTLMATTFLQVIQSQVLECYDDEDQRIRRDFGKFYIKEKQYGFKLEATSDEFGHADVGTAIVMTLPYAVQLLGGLDDLQKDDVIAGVADEELTEDEVKDMPDELRELFEMDEDDYSSKRSFRHDSIEEEW